MQPHNSRRMAAIDLYLLLFSHCSITSPVIWSYQRWSTVFRTTWMSWCLSPRDIIITVISRCATNSRQCRCCVFSSRCGSMFSFGSSVAPVNLVVVHKNPVKMWSPLLTHDWWHFNFSPFTTLILPYRVMVKDPFHANCLPVHIGTLVELGKANGRSLISYKL